MRSIFPLYPNVVFPINLFSIANLDPTQFAASVDLASFQAWVEECGADFFPAACMTATQRYDTPEFFLSHTEDHPLSGATPKRKREFSAGRESARTALTKLGIVDTHIPIGLSREPLWPDGMVGSISHSAGLAIAIVAPRSHFAAIGIDIELAETVDRSLWSDILTYREIEWILKHSATQHANLASVIFCAKESFYKLQFPATKAWVDFLDAEVSPDLDTGTFRLRCAQRSVARVFERREFVGKYILLNGFILVIMHLPTTDI
jgi:4'-phosphopantetheinyl transferase EntD